MPSSATGSTTRDEGDGIGRPARLDRTVERLDGGIVVTYELTADADADEPVTVDLTQALPEELAVADVGFRTDAAPAEWSVDGDTVQGTGTVPDEEAVEYVLGLKLPEAPDRLPSFPEPELTAAEGETTAETAETDGTDDTGTTDDTGESPPEGTEQAEDAPEDGPALVGNTDGALAESVRQVIGSDGESDDGSAETATTAATDGGPEAVDPGPDDGEAPAPRGTPTDADPGLEAAVAAVEDELEADDGQLAAGDEDDDEEPPELDLTAPESDEEQPDEDRPVEAEGPTDDGHGAEMSAAGSGDATAGDGPSGDGTSGDGTSGDAAAGIDLDELADRLATADEAERRAVREALGLGDQAAAGTVSVRVEQLESRVSAFEAYEDALAEFIDDTGTVEEVATTASEAAAAVDELRTEVAALRDEVATLRETLETAEAERTDLAEDLAAVRADATAAAELRTQLLDALRASPDLNGDAA